MAFSLSWSSHHFLAYLFLNIIIVLCVVCESLKLFLIGCFSPSLLLAVKWDKQRTFLQIKLERSSLRFSCVHNFKSTPSDSDEDQKINILFHSLTTLTAYGKLKGCVNKIYDGHFLETQGSFREFLKDSGEMINERPINFNLHSNRNFFHLQRND